MGASEEESNLLCKVASSSFVQVSGSADLEFRNFVEIVLFGGEVERHGGVPVCDVHRRSIAMRGGKGSIAG
jgi:hypothetical protein